MKKSILVLLVLATQISLPAQANADLAKAKACMACHSIDKKVIGPGFKEVAARYAGDKSMEAKLADKIKNGGTGAWGAMAMPPNNVTPAEATLLARWVLSQK